MQIVDCVNTSFEYLGPRRVVLKFIETFKIEEKALAARMQLQGSRGQCPFVRM